MLENRNEFDFLLAFIGDDLWDLMATEMNRYVPMDCAKREIQDSVVIAEEVNIGDFETTLYARNKCIK